MVPLPAPFLIGGRGAKTGRAAWQASPAAVRYGLAIGFVATAIALALLLEDIELHGTHLFAFYAAIMAATWFGGVGPGVLSLVSSTLLVEYYLIPPLRSLDVDLEHLPWFIAYLICAGVSLVLSSRRRQAELALWRARDTLETKVQERTAELLQANQALQAENAERRRAGEELRRSLSERKATEQALQDAQAEIARVLRLATLAELTASIAHEINQPLAAIVANAGACLRSLGRREPAIAQAREAASCIVSDGNRAGAVIARVRALATKEAPRYDLLDPNEVIRKTVDLMRPGIKGQRILLRIELAAALPPVLGDRVQLQQVLINLITNAIEAMSGIANRPRILTVRSRSDGDGGVIVEVADTGIGIDAKHADRIFDSFYTTRPDGIGVGLSISRSIVHGHGGRLAARPAAPYGALFQFNLPGVQP